MARDILIGICVALVAAAFFSFRAWDIGLQFTGDENFYFQSAKRMVETGDWLTPYYYGEPRFQKPILYYWFLAASFAILGPSWFAARLPSILFGSFTVLLVYGMGLLIFNKRRQAVLSACILATTFKFFKYTRFAMPDMALMFFVTASFYVLLRMMKGPGRASRLWKAFFILLALGMMTKGPIAVIIPLLSCAIFAVATKERIGIEKKDLLIGLGIFFAIVLPWFLLMLHRHGTTFLSHLWTRELTGRVLFNSEAPSRMERLTQYFRTLHYYIPIIIVRFLPWSGFLPAAVISVLRSKGPQKKELMLILSWFIGVFSFFSLMGEKHSQYMLALAMPSALLVGAEFHFSSLFNKRWRMTPAIVVIATACVFIFSMANKDLRLNTAILGGFANAMLSRGLSADDAVGAGSHSLIPQQIEVYLDRPVEKIGGKWRPPVDNAERNRLRLEEFFRYNGTAYCIISAEDYSKYIPDELKGRLNIIYRDFLWKRKLDLSAESMKLLAKGEIGRFLDRQKDEYYLVTNR